jgi:hypothetical protein
MNCKEHITKEIDDNIANNRVNSWVFKFLWLGQFAMDYQRYFKGIWYMCCTSQLLPIKFKKSKSSSFGWWVSEEKIKMWKVNGQVMAKAHIVSLAPAL